MVFRIQHDIYQASELAVQMTISLDWKLSYPT